MPRSLGLALLAAAALLVHCSPQPAPLVAAPTAPPPFIASDPAPPPVVSAEPPPPPPPSPPVEAASAPGADDIAEAVLRHLFHKNASGAQQSAGVVCLKVQGGDPDAAFLARFHDVSTLVRKVSDCDASAQGVFDKATHRRGLVFRVDSIDWKGGDSATASGGYFEAGLSASGNTYTMARKAGVWHVVKDVMNWISSRDQRPSPASRVTAPSATT